MKLYFNQKQLLTPDLFLKMIKTCVHPTRYHMYGTSVGKLMLISTVGQASYVVWERAGSQGNHWTQATINVHSPSNYQVSRKSWLGRVEGYA